MKIIGILVIAQILLGAPANAQPQITKTAVSFANKDIQLSGTLVSPAGKTQRPGMVLVHGSGPGPQTELMSIAESFAGFGMAVLVYDKRGSGKSGGNWITSSLFDLADDAVVAFEHLVSMPNIDGEASGYWGISQGGWILPLAMRRSDPAFGIVVTGGGASPRQVETASYLASASELARSEKSQEDVKKTISRYMSYLSGDISIDELRATFDSVRDEPWFSRLGIERVVPSPANRSNWEWVANFDTQESIMQVTAPMLVLFGALDSLVPVDSAANAWKNSLSKEQTKSEVRVLEGAGHGLRSGGHSGNLVEDYYSMQIAWLHSIGINIQSAAEVGQLSRHINLCPSPLAGPSPGFGRRSCKAVALLI